MADSLSLSITSTLGNTTQSVDLSPEDTARIVAWAQATIPTLMVQNDDFAFVPPATPPSFEATMAAVAAVMLNYLIAQEVNWQRQQAAHQAAMSVAPVQVTPSS